jgi:Protein of unknown function (DUF402)
MINLWKPGDIITWRGIYRNRIWHAQPTIVIQDSLEEIVLALLRGTECMAEESYPQRKKDGNRRWNYKDKDWHLETYTWQTNRLLSILDPGKYYSTMFFWDHDSNNFLCYYINFQLPFQRRPYGIDTLDLDLDLIISPDFSYEWKDVDDYQKAIEHEVIFPEWIEGIEVAKQEIFKKLEKSQYPFDGSWLNWLPDPNWSPPTLPENWDKI